MQIRRWAAWSLCEAFVDRRWIGHCAPVLFWVKRGHLSKAWSTTNGHSLFHSYPSSHFTFFARGDCSGHWEPLVIRPQHGPISVIRRVNWMRLPTCSHRDSINLISPKKSSLEICSIFLLNSADTAFGFELLFFAFTKKRQPKSSKILFQSFGVQQALV